MPNQRARRRLSDLYVRGREVEVDDGTGEPVVIWLQKMNELDRDAVLRRANTAKARYRLEAQQEEDELFVATLTSVRDFLDRDGQLAIACADELGKARQRIEEQMIHDEDGWGKDNKIQTLIDAWTGTDDTPGLAAAFAEDENDPEAVRVKEEIEAYEEDLNRAVELEHERIQLEWASVSDGDVALAATREVLNRKADEEFMREWSRQQIFHCVRYPDDHHKRYFGTLAEVDDLHDKVRQFLDDQCNDLFVSPAEGKDSPANTPSSTSSEPTVVEVRSALSGPEAATA